MYLFRDSVLVIGSNLGALIIRTESWARYTIIILRNPQNSMGSYYVPYITCLANVAPQAFVLVLNTNPTALL